VRNGFIFNLLGIDRAEFVIYVGYALVFGVVFYLSRMLLQEQESRAAADNLDEMRNRDASNILVKFTRPFFTQYIVPMVRGKPFWDNSRKVYKRKIISAGLKDEMTPDEFISFKLFQILFFPIIFKTLDVLGMMDIAWWFCLLSAVLGWFYPDLWVNSRIAARQKQIIKSMPFIVDLLALSTEAGLDFVGAIGKVVEKAKPSPMVDELGQVLKEIKVGSSRAEALREMSYRINMMEMNSFVSILISADQMGASIGKILRQQSEQIRIERMLRAEKAGAAAASRVILPTLLFIMPAVLLMIAGPFVISFMTGGGN
jgi:tight adherence protein C